MPTRPNVALCLVRCVQQTGSLVGDAEVLLLRNVSEDDAGPYTCMAGAASHSAWLAVAART